MRFTANGDGHVAGQVTDYLEGALDPGARGRFEAHVAVCPACTQLLREFRGTIRMLGALGREPLAPGARDRLVETFAAWRDGRA